MKSLTKFVISSFIICIIFTIIVLVFCAIGIEIPDQLISSFFLVFGIEFGATAGIQITKTILEKYKTNDYISNIQKHGLPLDKKDLKSDDDSDYYDGYTYG